MKQLVLLRGAPASGKSTFLKENGLEPFALSPDVLRRQCSAPVVNELGQLVTSQENDGKVWKLLFEILEERMKNGDFIIVDATHSTAKLINKYKQLRASYGYRTYVVNFDTPLETCLERNKQRKEYEFVPEEAIENIHKRLKHENIPSFAKVLKPEELLEEIEWKVQDFNQFDKVKVIGDIHGCYTALSKLITYEEVADNQNTAYVFVGDLFDRGLENVKVFELIESIYNLPNVFLIEGNHERHLRNYVKVYDELIDELGYSLGNVKKDVYNKIYKHFKARGFIQTTLKEFLDAEITKDRVKPILKKLLQCLYFELNGTQYIVTHGGILPNMVPHLNLVSTNQLINGIGGYEFEIDDEWTENDFYMIQNYITQIHGHRNLYRIPLDADASSINLEGRVEKGGHLRAITITKGNPFIKNKIETHEIKNDVFDSKWLISDDYTEKLDVELTVEQFIDAAKSDRKYIKVQNQYDNVYSVNFTPKLFSSGKWNQLAVHARGLFVKDDGIGSVVKGRAYNKFFNIDENKENKLDKLIDKLKFPVKAYRKENGYLGIMFYDNDVNEIVYASKSKTHKASSDNQYALWFKDIVENTLSADKLKLLKNELKEYDASAVFEVIDFENDPHVVKYERSKVVLLDVVKNQLQFERVNEDYSRELAGMIGLEHKELEFTFDNWQEFFQWYKTQIKNLDVKHEGWVLEDSKGFMLKIKTKWYKDWKYIRKFVGKIDVGNSPKQFILQSNHEVRDFYYWYKRNGRKTDRDSDLIRLRDEFYEQKS
ncbi:AAA family ATPase [Staphylococcus pseudintermedius]|nr:AAA family ATPase [Staphylococcus pseudintermedius]